MRNSTKSKKKTQTENTLIPIQGILKRIRYPANLKLLTYFVSNDLVQIGGLKEKKSSLMKYKNFFSLKFDNSCFMNANYLFEEKINLILNSKCKKHLFSLIQNGEPRIGLYRVDVAGFVNSLVGPKERKSISTNITNKTKEKIKSKLLKQTREEYEKILMDEEFHLNELRKDLVLTEREVKEIKQKLKSLSSNKKDSFVIKSVSIPELFANEIYFSNVGENRYDLSQICLSSKDYSSMCKEVIEAICSKRKESK